MAESGNPGAPGGVKRSRRSWFVLASVVVLPLVLAGFYMLMTWSPEGPGEVDTTPATVESQEERLEIELKSDANRAAMAIEEYMVDNPDFTGPLTVAVAEEAGFENFNDNEFVIEGTHADGYRVCVWQRLQSESDPQTMGYEFDLAKGGVQDEPVDCTRATGLGDD